MEHDDIDEDIERLKIILQDEEDEGAESDGELRTLENNEEDYYSNASRPSTSSDVTASSFPTTSVCTDGDDAMFRFDPNTITAETCLAMNRAYQEVLLDTLRQIEISLIENRTRQRELEENVDTKVKRTDKLTNKEISDYKIGGTPYFRDKSWDIPPFNEDVKLKEKMNEEKQHVRPKTGWSKKQRKTLMDAVKLDALEQVLRPLLSKQEVEMEKLSRCKNSQEIKEAKDRIEKLQEEIKQKQNLPADDLLKNVDSSKIDFLKISCTNSHLFGNKYSAAECESMWNAVLQPGINRNKWTDKEDEKLIELAEKYNKRNWVKIAEELKTNRTPYQCLQHFQQSRVATTPVEWTEEEDELLKEVVETCTYGAGNIKWQQVAYYIDGKSGADCRSRWNKIDPKRLIGRWTNEEDLQLLDGIQTYGGVLNWTKIQEHVPTRTAAQCRERFVSRMSGDVLYKPWTYEDDKKLLMLYEKFGSNWIRIAKEFEGRSDNMVLLRHQRLLKWQRISEAFFSQPLKVQKDLKHQAFRILKTGEVVPKPGLKLRFCKRGSFRRAQRPKEKNKYKSEIQKLKEASGVLAKDLQEDNANEMKDEPAADDDDDDDDDHDEQEMDRPMKLLQDSLDAFTILYNIEAHDYYKQIVDKKEGGIVVPRPPPIKKNKMNLGLSLWKRQDSLHHVVASQIDLYVKQLQEKLHEGSDGSTAIELNLYEQISKNMKKGNDENKKRMIAEAFKGKNPCNLSVRELLNISRCIKDHGKPPKNPKRYDLEPWEVETSDEEKGEVTSSESDQEEELTEEEPKKKRPSSEKQKAYHKQLKIDVRKRHTINYQIKRLILSKMDSREVNHPTRSRKFLMYPKSILMKYKGLDEERRLNRKSFVLLMKSLDINSRKAYFKARKGKRKLSALAMLKTTENASTLKKAKTRQQKRDIQEAVKMETNINMELSEVSDYLLDLKDELKINVNETDENIDKMLADDEKLQDRQQYGYNKSLPYIPPNRTNLLGMKTLLLEHRSLIDQAGTYFNTEELKKKLYKLKERGPNPLMNVLNAIGKTESAAKKRDGERQFTPSSQVCKKQMDEVRKTTAYQKLKARFRSVFTWPALLSTIQPPSRTPLPLELQVIRQKADSSKNVVPEPETVTETDNVEEDLESLPEEEAVEKLVDKIMEEYEKERAKRKRHLPVKKYRNFSDKRKRAFVERERTKILKRLGLYEKMQEYKRQRLEAAARLNKVPLPLTSNVKPVVTSTVTSSASTSTDVKNKTSLIVTSLADASITPSNIIPINDLPSTSKTPGTDAECMVDMDDNNTNTPCNSTDRLVQGGINEITSNNRKEDKKPMNVLESCQADFSQDDKDTTLPSGETGSVGKRKRGRPAGSKTKCYSDTSPVRKSQRTSDAATVVKLEQDFEVSPRKKKSQSSKRGSQYNFVRSLIPGKMSKIAAHISDLPILNEPMPEVPVKPVKKPTVVKPPKEKKRVAKSKFDKVEKDNIGRKKSGPKTNRILQQLYESEKANVSETNLLIKTEPLDSEEELTASDSVTIYVTENAERIVGRKEANVEKIQTNAKMETNVKRKETNTCMLEINANRMETNAGRLETNAKRMETNAGGFESNAKRIETNDGRIETNAERIVTNSERIGTNAEMYEPRQIKTARARRIEQNRQQGSSETVNGVPKSAVIPNQTKVQKHNDIDCGTQHVALSEIAKVAASEKSQAQTGNIVGSAATNVREPLFIAVPVMIAGIQQVACIPFYPDEEGKITLPNGKKVDAAVASNQGAPSMPVIDFNQPLQVVNPLQQPSTTVVSTGQQVLGANDLVPKQTIPIPQVNVSLLNQGTVKLGEDKQIPGQSISLLNKSETLKNSVTSDSSSEQTTPVDLNEK